MKWILRGLAGLLCAAMLAGFVSAEGAFACLGEEWERTPEGILLTRLPGQTLGTVMLDSRVLRPGDVLTGEQAARMTFSPAAGAEGKTAQVSCLPIYDGCVSEEVTMTLAIHGKENKPPIAEDSAFETYKNLEVSGKLKVKEPEEETMTFTLVRQPKRGTVEIAADGTFTYTPKKNKVGIDSFTYIAADAAGQQSREATVTVTILKPTDAAQYTDTVGEDCRFAAEWMKNTGIFCGEQVGGSACFSPEKTVSQGEFVTMLVKALDIPVEEEVTAADFPEAPAWLRPYLAAAVRSGLTAGVQLDDPAAPVSAEIAAGMLCNALDLDADVMAREGEEASAQSALAEREIVLPEGPLTRAETAAILYRLSRLVDETPKLRVWN